MNNKRSGIVLSPRFIGMRGRTRKNSNGVTWPEFVRIRVRTGWESVALCV